MEQLEALLAQKAQQIHETALLGAALLEQQELLHAHIQSILLPSHSSTGSEMAQELSSISQHQLAQSLANDHERTGDDAKRQLRQLEQEMQQWDPTLFAQNQSTSTTNSHHPIDDLVANGTGEEEATTISSDPFKKPLLPKQSRTNLATTSTLPSVLPPPQVTSATGSPPASPSAQAALRRSRNTANPNRPANDVELVSSISTSLVAEVRRLQGVLLEKEGIIREERDVRQGAERGWDEERSARERIAVEVGTFSNIIISSLHRDLFLD